MLQGVAKKNNKIKKKFFLKKAGIIILILQIRKPKPEETRNVSHITQLIKDRVGIQGQISWLRSLHPHHLVLPDFTGRIP